MRFTYAETFCDPTFLALLAQAAEEAGYNSFTVPDSLIYPAESDARYPYTADVTDVVVGFRYPYVAGQDTETLQHKLDALRRVADTLVAQTA
jgi:alkanesulfonate monooxygenase SsuD/methylene tetrahydromethanopterin reductase-like flavin-dependent oxidoreductase (luciferase family)